MVFVNFSKIVKEALNQKGWTITQLAKEMGYCVQHVSDLLSGERRWNETTMSRACEVLGIQVVFSVSGQEIA